MVLSDSAVSIRTTKSTAQGRDSVEESSFSFDSVFHAKTTQAQVFDSAMLPQVKSLFSGRDTLTFAYGITNAGKTYTVQGRGDGDEMGMLPRALDSVFVALRHHAERRAAKSGQSAPSSNDSVGLSGPATQLKLDDACTCLLYTSPSPRDS